MHEDLPLVSVIIPTYNQKNLVEETLISVFSQTYPKLEIIICDDGSIDGTLDVVKNLCSDRSDVIILPSDFNSGIANNVNKGLAVFTGKYLAWLGGDDVMQPDKIQLQVDFLEGHPEFSGVCHDSMLFCESHDIGLFSDIMNNGKKISVGDVSVFFEIGYYLLPSSMMIRGDLVGQLRFDNRLRYNNDWLFDIEYFRGRSFFFIDKPLVKYRRHSSNITGEAGFVVKSIEDNFIAMSIVIARYPSLGKMAVKIFRHALFKAFFASIRAGEFNAAFLNLRTLISCGAWVRGSFLLIAMPLLVILGNKKMGGLYFYIKRLYKFRIR